MYNDADHDYDKSSREVTILRHCLKMHFCVRRRVLASKLKFKVPGKQLKEELSLFDYEKFLFLKLLVY